MLKPAFGFMRPQEAYAPSSVALEAERQASTPLRQALCGALQRLPQGAAAQQLEQLQELAPTLDCRFAPAADGQAGASTDEDDSFWE
jgi:hypothetical protein